MICSLAEACALGPTVKVAVHVTVYTLPKLLLLALVALPLITPVLA